MLRKIGRDFLGNVFLAYVHFADHLYKLPPGNSFEHVSSSACLERATNFYVSFEGRKHNNASICKLCANGDHRIDATDVGQSEIHECNVGAIFTEALYGLASTG